MILLVVNIFLDSCRFRAALRLSWVGVTLHACALASLSLFAGLLVGFMSDDEWLNEVNDLLGDDDGYHQSSADIGAGISDDDVLDILNQIEHDVSVQPNKKLDFGSPDPEAKTTLMNTQVASILQHPALFFCL